MTITIDAAGNLRGAWNTNQALRRMAQFQAAQTLVLRGGVRRASVPAPVPTPAQGMPFWIHNPGDRFLSRAEGRPSATNVREAFTDLFGRAAVILLEAQRALTTLGIMPKHGVSVLSMPEDYAETVTYGPEDYVRLEPGPRTDGSADHIDYARSCMLNTNNVLTMAAAAVDRLAMATGAHPVRMTGQSDMIALDAAGLPLPTRFPAGDAMSGVAYDQLQPMLPTYAAELVTLATAYNAAAHPSLDLPVLAV